MELSEQPVISKALFRKLVCILSARELRKLPLDKLPTAITRDMYRGAPRENIAVVEDFIMQLEVERLSARVSDLDVYGPQAAEAMALAEQDGFTVGWQRFEQKLYALEAMLERWRAGNLPSIAALSETNQQLDEPFTSLRADGLALLTAQETLQGVEVPRGPAHARFEAAIEELDHRSQPLKEIVARYYALRLDISFEEMSDLRQRLKRQDSDQEDLQMQIDSLRAELDRQQSMWRRALARYHSSPLHSELQGDISRLIAEKQSGEVVISDDALQRWLDAIVEVSLDPLSKGSSRIQIQPARILLFSLLSQYCQQQEDSALQIARNPFSRVNAKQAIQYVLLSEQFILDYFARKKNDRLFWLSGAAESRRDKLDGLMKDVLKELKRSLRSLG